MLIYVVTALSFFSCQGTTYVYDSFFKPYVAKHESEIDRNLLELRTRAGDMAVLYWQRAMSYGQSRVFEILQYVAAQSTPKPHLAQVQQQGSRAHQPLLKRQPSAASSRQPAATQPEIEESLSTASSSSSGQNPLGLAEEIGPSRVSEPDLPPVASNDPKANVISETSSQSTRNEAEVMQIDVAPSSSANENVNTISKETVIEETSQVSSARLRKTQSGENQKNA
uniref:Putative HVA22-like protein g n=1 Tax=Rhizophora mucronata TaxID=61149 RepID=A0A2P2L1Z2_RHIMU